MVDLHAHILPGLDDGASGWDESLKMLRLAVDDGITAIAATPHVASGVFENTKQAISELAAKLRQRASGLPIEIYEGGEVLAGPDTVEGVEAGLYPTINGGRYLLLELPVYFQPAPVNALIYELTSRGFVPVIAHPERNSRLLSDPEVLFEMVRLGALSQVTSGSLTGIFGGAVRKFAGEILLRRMAHILASDAHTSGRRAPLLSEGARQAAKLVGKEAADAMVDELPMRMLRDEGFDPPAPLEKKKGFFGF